MLEVQHVHPPAVNGTTPNSPGDESIRRPVTKASRVAALVPHYHCEEWLSDCLDSLVSQTRPLDAIFVIDDGSGNPPIDIVSRYPQVTLLESAENVGPYRLVQQVMNDTDYDAYMFQDADDWSSADRLELLLEEAERTGAELIGTQEVRIGCDIGDAWTWNYPLDVNEQLRAVPYKYALYHPTSLVSRDLVARLGGYATGMRFSGDREFLARAVHVALVKNIPNYCYFRRKRDGSLTTDPETGLGSPERTKVQKALDTVALRLAAERDLGVPVALAPYSMAPSIQLSWLTGPRHAFDQGDWAGSDRGAMPARQAAVRPDTPNGWFKLPTNGNGPKHSCSGLTFPPFRGDSSAQDFQEEGPLQYMSSTNGLHDVDKLRREGGPFASAIADAIQTVARHQASSEEQRWTDGIEQLRAAMEQSNADVSVLSQRTAVETRATLGSVCRRGVSPLWGSLLLHLIRMIKPATVLELGSGAGVSTAYLATGLELNGSGEFVSVEGSAELASLATRNLQALNLGSGHVVAAPFTDVTRSLPEALKPLDFVFIDGHQYEGPILEYFDTLLPHLSEGAAIVLDDIASSPGMTAAWKSIKAHQATSTSIDLGRFGIAITGLPQSAKTHVAVQAISHLAPDGPNEGVECPVCQGRFVEFLPYGLMTRPNERCPRCGSQKRHRLLSLFLERETPLFTGNVSLLHFAPERQLEKRLKSLPNLRYYTCDLAAENAMVKTDITALGFKDNAFDGLVCYHVLEHIPDDGLAMRELYRVLKPGGFAVLQVPLDKSLEKSFEDESITSPEDRERYFLQRDHVRLYGLDFGERLTKAGFAVCINQYANELDPHMRRRFGVDGSAEIYVCSKPVTQ